MDGPGSKYLASPRSLFTITPAQESQSSLDKHAFVPTICAKTPPQSMLATSIQRHFKARTKERFTTSRDAKFNSVQLPAPSKTITLASVACAKARCDWIIISFIGPVLFPRSPYVSRTICLPKTTTLHMYSPFSFLPPDLSNRGFISTRGTNRQASACKACAVPISPYPCSSLLEAFKEEEDPEPLILLFPAFFLPMTCSKAL
mmetsp:Transcript_41098/g.99057  ORF Transcript_41098/g.99057 Transcript_41098/m.99057 type:complete len:203 (-) Transcript_41098:283-891(-)